MLTIYVYNGIAKINIYSNFYWINTMAHLERGQCRQSQIDKGFNFLMHVVINNNDIKND